MIYKFQCKTCGQRIAASLDLYGTTATCPTCAVKFTVPHPSDADFARLAELITSGASSPPAEAPKEPAEPPAIYKFHCHACGQRMSATPDQFGTTNDCPACGAEFIVPAP